MPLSADFYHAWFWKYGHLLVYWLYLWDLYIVVPNLEVLANQMKYNQKFM